MLLLKNPQSTCHYHGQLQYFNWGRKNAFRQQRCLNNRCTLASTPQILQKLIAKQNKHFICQALNDKSLYLYNPNNSTMADKKQAEMREDIASFHSKKDYYDILGISKTATDAQIKKAYRNLALRFHPDKNQQEGAKQVFKKVSNAYSVLIDAEKRAHYDRFGPEEERSRPQRQEYAQEGDYEYQQFDDLFRAFFGGMPMHGHQRRGNVYTYQFGNNQNRGQGQGQAQAQQGGFNFYYIFIIFFVIYTLAPLFESKPNYSTLPSGDYRLKTKTSILNVEFYVNQKYFQEAKNGQYKRTTEMVIDREHITALQKNCEVSKREKRRLQEFAYRQNPGPRRQSFINQAKLVNMMSCRMINEYRENHEDYLRDLTYMR